MEKSSFRNSVGATTTYSSLVTINPDSILATEHVKAIKDSDKKRYDLARSLIDIMVMLGPLKPQLTLICHAPTEEGSAVSIFLLELHYSRPPSMCLKPSVAQRESGWFRLVTAFWKVAHYCQPQPSLMPLPDVDSTLRWRGFLLFLAAIFLNWRDGNCQPVIWLIGMDD